MTATRMVDGQFLETPSEIAAWLRLTPAAIILHAQRGLMPCVWWGPQPLFLERDIELWLRDETYRTQSMVELEDLELPPFPDEPPAPYQRKDGRWSVRLVCADGIERRFVSRRVEVVQVEHQRKGRPRPPIAVRTRFDVLRRDRFTCRYCGRRPPDVVLELDHVLAVVDGGRDEPENLVTSCVDCNLGKRERSIALAEIAGISHESVTASQDEGVDSGESGELDAREVLLAERP